MDINPPVCAAFCPLPIDDILCSLRDFATRIAQTSSKNSVKQFGPNLSFWQTHLDTTFELRLLERSFTEESIMQVPLRSSENKKILSNGLNIRIVTTWISPILFRSSLQQLLSRAESKCAQIVGNWSNQFESNYWCVAPLTWQQEIHQYSFHVMQRSNNG